MDELQNVRQGEVAAAVFHGRQHVLVHDVRVIPGECVTDSRIRPH